MVPAEFAAAFGPKQVAALDFGLVEVVDGDNGGAEDGGFVDFPADPVIAAGGVDVGAGGEPVPFQNRVTGGGDGNGHSHIGKAFLGGVHRGNFQVQAFRHALGELFPAFRAAAIDFGALDGADGADGFELAAGLKAGADDADAGGIPASHPTGSEAGGGAGADLPQAAGFHTGKEGAAGVVVEHHDHSGAAGKGGIGFVAENLMPGVGGGHKVKETAGHSDAGTGFEVHLAGAGVGKGFLEDVDALSHREQLGYFGFVEKEGHYCLRDWYGMVRATAAGGRL